MSLISEITQIGLWVWGFGALTLFWVIYSIVMFFLDRKKIKELRENLKEINDKLDKLIKKK